MADTKPFDLRRDFLRVLLHPALSLLLVPAVTLGFARLARSMQDGVYLESIRNNIDVATDIPAEEKPRLKAFYEANPPSGVCTNDDAELARYREGVCSTGSEMWQFVHVETAAWIALLLGVAGLAGALALGFIASRKPTLQYVAFVTGWRSLSFVAAVQAIVQGTFLTWLSFWVTALFFNIYVPKLIFIIGALAVFGIWTAVRGIFRNVSAVSGVEGEVLAASDAPGLVDRVKELAGRVGTEPPANIVGGIDDNFFVTESPLVAGETQLSGRTLFVSLPLLRVLEATEADAVLAHELAHFRGGDTAASARLGPALVRYDGYAHELSQGLTTLPAFYVMVMFRTVFELALSEERRRREFTADRVAAEHTSAEDLGKALLKTTAYSSHRAATENELFAQQQRHEAALGIRERVHTGLGAHVATAQFKQVVQASSVPHPFDSHPPLDTRLSALGTALTPDDCGRILEAPPARTWVDGVEAAEAIETRLWTAYERRFTDAHELSLTYRYLPSTDEERALVEKHFPEQTFTQKAGTTLRLTYEALELPGAAQPLLLAEIIEAKIDDGNFSTTLVLTHSIDSRSGKGPTKVDLRALGGEQEAFKARFGAYWHRARVAHQAAQGAAQGAVAAT